MLPSLCDSQREEVSLSVRSFLPIALQLYTVRDQVARDLPGTLHRVAAMGYDGVEFAGYGGLEAGALRDLLQQTGLAVAGTHVPAERLEADFDAEARFCHEIGCRDLVVPSLPDHLDAARDPEAVIRLLNDLGARCREAGLRFGYHNHDSEFAPCDGGTLWERMLAGTDATLVSFELDLYWAAFAGQDVWPLLREYGGRIPLVHFKDMAEDRRYTEVGAGSLGLEAVYRQGAELGIRWAIVELDQPLVPSLESAERSLRALRAAREVR